MNGEIKSRLSQIKALVEGTKEQVEILNTLIEKSSIGDVLIIQLEASRHRQETFNIFSILEQTAQDHAQKIYP